MRLLQTGAMGWYQVWRGGSVKKNRSISPPLWLPPLYLSHMAFITRVSFLPLLFHILKMDKHVEGCPLSSTLRLSPLAALSSSPPTLFPVYVLRCGRHLVAWLRFTWWKKLLASQQRNWCQVSALRPLTLPHFHSLLPFFPPPYSPPILHSTPSLSARSAGKIGKNTQTCTHYLICADILQWRVQASSHTTQRRSSSQTHT